MNNAKLLYFIGVVIIWSLRTVVATVNGPECPDSVSIDSGGFRVSSQRRENISIEITCHGDDWNSFPDIKINCNAVGKTKFINCAHSQSLLDTFHKINVNYSGKIYFVNLTSLPSRQYFQKISVAELKFVEGNFSVLPFDLLYDVLDLRNLTIQETSLLRIPSNFFSSWSRQLLRVDFMLNKLQKIAKDDFASLVELRELMLYGNEIAEIEAGAFDNLRNLIILDISKNHLHTLPSGIFRHLAKLNILHIGQNQFDELPADLLTGIDNCQLTNFQMNVISGSMKTMPAKFFKNITSLKDVWLQGAQLESLPSDLFADTSELVNLNLRNNSLRSLPLGLFENLKKLKTLILTDNLIATLPAGIFVGLDHIDFLDISYNNLTSLNADVLRGLSTLKSFIASHNDLNKVDENFCGSLGSVEVIDFSFNRLTFQATRHYNLKHVSIFITCAKLHKMSLSHNKATEIFEDYKNRKEIDLSYNHLSELTVQDIQNFNPIGTKINLRNNQISKINLMELPSVVKAHNDLNKNLSRSLKIALGNNPLQCDCHLIEFVRYWKSDHKDKLREFVRLTENINDESDGSMVCASPAEFKNHKISDISPEELSCPLTTALAGDACNDICTCREYPAKETLTLDCSNRYLTQIPAMISNVHIWSIELNMSHNMLKHTPSLATSPYLTNVSSLDLSSNNISGVTLDLFSENLVDLKLHNNSISRLDEQVIKYLAGKDIVRSITLHQNPWQCDCEAHNFLNFIQKKTAIYALDRVACYGTNKKLYKMTVRDICKDAIAIIVGISLLVALFGIVIGILAALYYKYQQEIKVWLYSKQWCLWFVTEDELDKEKKYDAFVSFSHKDEDFVEKEIVAKLEDGPNPYKLCLHYRDWLAGEWIPVQISQSVEESRRTIVVLSPNFLESVWGRMEFRTAHTQALKEGRARVIIILYGEIENMEDLDPELKTYLSLNTYIKWGDPWFWDKLRYALPHRFEPSRRRTRKARLIEDHLIHQTANNETANAIIKSDVISMSKLANDSAKLLDPSLDDRMAASC